MSEELKAKISVRRIGEEALERKQNRIGLDEFLSLLIWVRYMNRALSGYCGAWRHLSKSSLLNCRTRLSGRSPYYD